jgi:inorganic pyrophosphatase/exopolyphosphatase
MQILYSLIGGAVIAIIVTWYFSKKAEKFNSDLNKKVEKLEMDLSGFIIQEITKNTNYVYPVIGEDGKLHKAINLELEDGIIFNGTTTGVKKE